MKVALVSYGDRDRSSLNSQPPVGFTTSVCESVESYLERLMHAHDIQRKHLERFVKGDLPSDASNMAYTRPIRVDSPGPAANAFAGRLAELTHQPQVARLGLGWLTNVLANADALRSEAAWCPLCIADCHHGRRPCSLPLLWSLKPAEACIVHRVVLATTCENCLEPFTIRSGLRFPFLNCPQCLVPLDSRCSKSREMAPRASPLQLAATDQVGAFVAQLQSRAPDAVPLTVPDFRRVITSAVARGICSGTIDLVRKAQLSKATLTSLLRGEKAGFDTWVRVAMAADVSLAGLFAPELWAEGGTGIGLSWRSRLSLARQRPPLDWTEVRRSVELMLESEQPLEIAALARRLAVDAKHLKSRLGALAPRLQQAAALRRKGDEARAVVAMAHKIKEEITARKASGRRVSARSVAQRLDVSRHGVVFAQAFHAASAALRGRGYIGRKRLLARSATSTGFLVAAENRASAGQS